MVAIKAPHTIIIATPESITHNGITVRWRRHKSFGRGNIKMVVTKGINMRVMIGEHITLHVLRHLYLPNIPSKVDHLGFYIERDSGLSSETDGLIGEIL